MASQNPAEILRGGTVWSGYLRLDGVGGGLCLKTENPLLPEGLVRFHWLRGQDLNLRPLGYEPNELPDCSTPRHLLRPTVNSNPLQGGGRYSHFLPLVSTAGRARTFQSPARSLQSCGGSGVSSSPLSSFTGKSADFGLV